MTRIIDRLSIFRPFFSQKLQAFEDVWMTFVEFASENNELADKYLLSPITNIRP